MRNVSQYHNTTPINANTTEPAKYCLVRSLIKMKEKQLNSGPRHTIRYQKTLWWKMKTKNQLP